MKQILLFLALLIGTYSFAQCPKPGDVLKADNDNGWGQNSQSKSGPLRSGDEYEMRFVAQSGLKYRITAISGNEVFLADNIDFQLVGKEVKEVKKNGKSVYETKEIVFLIVKKLERMKKQFFRRNAHADYQFV
jgi:hypothetical protein